MTQPLHPSLLEMVLPFIFGGVIAIASAFAYRGFRNVGRTVNNIGEDVGRTVNNIGEDVG